jgi:hypothetical protein
MRYNTSWIARRVRMCRVECVTSSAPPTTANIRGRRAPPPADTCRVRLYAPPWNFCSGVLVWAAAQISGFNPGAGPSLPGLQLPACGRAVLCTDPGAYVNFRSLTVNGTRNRARHRDQARRWDSGKKDEKHHWLGWILGIGHAGACRVFSRALRLHVSYDADGPEDSAQGRLTVPIYSGDRHKMQANGIRLAETAAAQRLIDDRTRRCAFVIPWRKLVTSGQRASDRSHKPLGTWP